MLSVEPRINHQQCYHLEKDKRNKERGREKGRGGREGGRKEGREGRNENIRTEKEERNHEEREKQGYTEQMSRVKLPSDA